ncbi:hypothetical protein VMT65_33145 [Nocardia sp. CDC153]|uniref:hypothetical protein n=1 Tax=Nocardia sp. CDC153 TaxID=3112167 RepID=UPI002DBC4904|nr:hypothetical protein [Nocardia sp. CDC153]MEC3957923.1 hypothetical protein [Nocardia sp. CDC153]
MATRYQTPGIGSAAMLLALRLPTGLPHSVGELRYEGRRSGRHIALPVGYVLDGDTVVIRVGHAGAKTWWRNFRSPRAASIRIDGAWRGGLAAVAMPDTLAHERLDAVYRRAHPRTPASGRDPYMVIDLATTTHPAHTDREFRRRWFTTVTAGEFLGFLAPAVAGALTAHASAAVVAVAMLAAGAVEGAVLGRFQAGVLRMRLSRLRIRDWTAATSAGAVVAWMVGVLPMLYGEQFGSWPTWAQVPAAVAGSLVIVFSLVVAQWMVLHRFTDRAGLWILANAAAWAAGLAGFMVVAPPLWQPGQPPFLVAAIGALGGVVMAAAMAWVTGAFQTRVLADGHLVTTEEEPR